MTAKRATIAIFARFCIVLQCFCCGRPPSRKSKSSTKIAANIVLYPEIPIAPSNHSCGRSLPFFLGPSTSAPLHPSALSFERMNDMHYNLMHFTFIHFVMLLLDMQLHSSYGIH